LKTIIAFITSLLMLSSLNVSAAPSHQQSNYETKEQTAYRCFDVNNRNIQGIWNQRDARLIDRVGGSCTQRGQDEGDLRELKRQDLSKRDLKKALRKARKRFPELLDGAWLVGAYDVKNSGRKNIRYKLVYDNLTTNERIQVKIKQNQWSGKIRKMRARTI